MTDDEVDTHAINVAAFRTFHETHRTRASSGGRDWVVYRAPGVN